LQYFDLDAAFGGNTAAGLVEWKQPKATEGNTEGKMIYKHTQPAMVAVKDSVYILNGVIIHGESEYKGFCERWDSLTHTFTPIAHMGCRRVGMTAVYLKGINSILCTGGREPGAINSHYAQTELYSIANVSGSVDASLFHLS
jgi:hypothetical protein